MKRTLQPRIHRLAFERQDAEHTLVDAPQRFALHEALEAFDAKGELAKSQ